MASQRQQHRHSTCHRHPTKPATGLCASCLRERLSGIDSDTHQETLSTHLSSELRRTRSHSSTSSSTTATTNTNPNAASCSSSSNTTTVTTTATRPRRKSFDIKPHNSLSDLFVIDDEIRRKNTPKTLPLSLELKEEEENGVSESKANGYPRGVLHLEEDFEDGGGGDLKTMKEFIDLELERKRQNRKAKDFRVIADTLFGAASLFRKRLGILQRKQKTRRKNEVERGVSDRKLREVQSEVGEYGFLGRRSCDTDPRLSIDVGRLSVDDSRHSFDCEPGRVSWDGCSIGARTYPKLMPLVSVVEDSKLSNEDVEDLQNEREGSPGGTVQAREYYSDGRRRSFDRSGFSSRVGLVDDELKSMSNAKVSPEGVGLFHRAKLLVTEKELKDSNWYSHKDYSADSIDSVAKDADSVAKGKKVLKANKSRRLLNMWSMLGFMQRKTRNKCEKEENSISVNDANGDQNGAISQELMRSCTASMRGSGVASTIDPKEKSTKRREELYLQRNRSVRYSPNNFDNGLLRFYLTPSRMNSGRSKSARNSVSSARNYL